MTFLSQTPLIAFVLTILMVAQHCIRTFDVSLADLLESGFMVEDSEIVHNYTPRGGTKQTFVGIVSKDGTIAVLDQNYSSPSFAALACIQAAGSDRTTVNGWTSWRTTDGKTLADVRSEFLAQREREAEHQDDVAHAKPKSIGQMEG